MPVLSLPLSYKVRFSADGALWPGFRAVNKPLM